MRICGILISKGEINISFPQGSAINAKEGKKRFKGPGEVYDHKTNKQKQKKYNQQQQQKPVSGPAGHF